MHAVGTILVLLWMAAVVLGIIALARGHIDWLRLRSRKAAVMFLLAAQILLVAGGLMLPKTSPQPVAAPVTSVSPAATTATSTAPPTTTPAKPVAPASTAPPPSRVDPTTNAPVAPPPPLMSADQMADVTYIAVLDENEVRYASRDAAISVGHSVCTARAAGNTEAAIGMTILGTGLYSAQDAGVIVGAAEAAYCPAYK